MDELDTAIVRELQRDARQTNRELARTLGIAPSTCLERVRGLRERGVITGYRATVDLRALNRPVQALLAVRIRPPSREVI
ncbi:Lrp/AsnC family transcriptional regulator, partial [Streptomyces sp. MCAF7]